MKKNMKEFYKPEDLERRVILILKILHESAEPLGARVIARRMLEQNIQLSERTVRYHLKIMDERGLTKLVGRRDGRMITDKGESEISENSWPTSAMKPAGSMISLNGCWPFQRWKISKCSKRLKK